MTYQTLSVRREGPVVHVTLNRPDVRNAFNPALIEELDSWAHAAFEEEGVRVAVLSGAGKAFCAGADLQWMAASASYTREENVQDARLMAAMFAALDRLPFPLIGRVHGAALGGGAGLVAVCDIVVAEEGTLFGFTEVKLGLIPAVISPYVMAKIGVSAARELFLTGARFSAARAKDIGLIHAAVAADQVETATADYVKQVLTSGPGALRAAKEMLRMLAGEGTSNRELLRSVTAELIATRRVSAEGQEGLRAFLEKRKPSWID